MKGLIIKDLMCLRKQSIVFAFAVIGTIALSIMFVLSARFGNIYTANQNMMIENQISAIDVQSQATTVLMFFMIIPIALVGDVSTVFTYDGKAGFANVCATFPLSIEKRVLAKFITVLVTFGIGISIDLLISFVLSILTDIITFGEFLGIIVSFASLMIINGALAIFFMFCVGYGKEGLAQMLCILTMAAAVVLAKYQDIKKVVNEIITPEVEDNSLSFVNDLIGFLKYRFYILFIIAVFVYIISYFGTVAVAKRKRGMI